MSPTREASAATSFNVTTTLDVSDPTPDGVCDSAPGGTCSLREAIQESNADAGPGTVSLPAGTYTLSLACSSPTRPSGSLKTPRPDAWRCIAGNRILDPCFSNSTTDLNYVLCLDVPWVTVAHRLDLDEPLPSDTANSDFSPQTAAPWAMQLANGQRCVLLGGATTQFAGERVNYGCDDGYIVGDPDRSNEVWTALYGNEESTTLQAEHVGRAWF